MPNERRKKLSVRAGIKPRPSSFVKQPLQPPNHDALFCPSTQSQMRDFDEDFPHSQHHNPWLNYPATTAHWSRSLMTVNDPLMRLLSIGTRRRRSLSSARWGSTCFRWMPTSASSESDRPTWWDFLLPRGRSIKLYGFLFYGKSQIFRNIFSSD